MGKKYFALPESKGHKNLFDTNWTGELEPVYVLSAEEWAKRTALYHAINHVVDYAGAHGSIDARGDRMQAVMDALYAIDGGIYNEEPTK